MTITTADLLSLPNVSEYDADRILEAIEVTEGARTTRARMVENVLEMAALAMGAAAFGFEPLTPDGEIHAIAFYVNAGDPYRTTLLYDVEECEFVIGCWGDVLEAFEAENGGHCSSCGEREDRDCNGRFRCPTCDGGMDAQDEADADPADLDTFVKAYVECALWSSTDEDGESLDVHGIDSVAPSALVSMADDCRDFMTANAADLADADPAQAGHDFWLTRNRHGAGFWDGDYPSAIGQRLTKAAHVYGSADLYVGDDGLIYCQ